MSLITKGDLVQAALRKLGVASDATLTDIEPQSLADAVSDLEMMMAEWYQDGAGIDTGYQFSDAENPPAEGDEHGMKSSAVSAVVHNLALRIAPDYAVEPSVKLINTARYGKELLYKQSAITRARKSRSDYPARMPIGSGNHWATVNDWHFYPGKKLHADSTTSSDEG
ncbi:packaged DNA stabilization gp4 family protein [Xenorhabdus sp. SF857]|uniref:packaged DNA stabilization gp4 family protein n=1 Tax=Xenorhabdus bakwenae TaxID=3026967 RepID=UPI002558317B|nr:packaged DNA stabilization gp4 family protein [Xenorhabdus sp. SF857]WFQ80096.1 packaged DNA stabilization gp4 family protein [Xenorhabdus sp. SF857]